MQELKGFNTNEFYSRFFVETALENHLTVSKDETKKLGTLAEKFLFRYHDLDMTSSVKEIMSFQDWFHKELLSTLGYSNLEAFAYESSKNKFLPIRGKLSLLDNEELWIMEGLAGSTLKSDDSLNLIPHCDTLLNFQDESLKIDKTHTYEKHIREILAGDNKCSWILLLAGEKTYLFERKRTLELGTYMDVSWHEVFANKDDKVYKCILGLFGYESFKVVGGDIAHNQLSETAHREAHGVTRNLKHAVRDSLEILINEALYTHKNIKSSAVLRKLEKEMTNEELAKALADEGLRFLYRLLFLFFVESRGRENELIPVSSPGYSLGYSLENLRNLELKKTNSSGNFIQETLLKTFQIMFHGININYDFEKIKISAGFECPRVGTLLFDENKTPILNSVHLRDQVLKNVIAKLSLSEMGKGKNKKMARISYSNLGLNQLGAVYEGLLSLKPIITDAQYATAIIGTRDEEFLIPKSEMKKFKADQLMQDENGKPIIHEKGEFLFRTMGYERKYSASFYTDEVLTKCLVKECLDEHFKSVEHKPSCKMIEEMKILEPAMGSGAFLNETANQLSVYYADAMVRENRHLKNLDGIKVEIPRIELIAMAKEFIMKNCLYGVDLNPMATELAKVSLWLNCIHKNGQFAFHDFKIRRGNSLVGAFVRQKASFSDAVHHFLAPMPAMLDTYINAFELGDKKRPFFDDKTIARLKKIKEEFSKVHEYESELSRIAQLVDRLYKAHAGKREEFQRTILAENMATTDTEKYYNDYVKNNTEYYNLRKVMDYWCSLWFWRVEWINQFPDLKTYIQDVKSILESGKLSSARESIFKDIINAVPFFHYDLEFPEVFKKGGFDLVLGNPPWAKLAWSDRDFFFDINQSYYSMDISSKDESKFFQADLKNDVVNLEYRNSMTRADGIRSYLKNSVYPFDDSSEVNTYKYFWQRSHMVCKPQGTYGLIKQGGILTDKGTEGLRSAYYKELKCLYSFINEKKLFEVDNHVEYVVAVFNRNKKHVDFEYICNLYHPITIERCRKASLESDYPGMKDSEGNFNLNGHPLRVIKIDDLELTKILGGGEFFRSINKPLPSIHGSLENSFLGLIHSSNIKIYDVLHSWNLIFHETDAPKKGLIQTWSKDVCSNKAVLTGPNIDVGNPYYKFPNPGCKNNRDYSSVSLKDVSDDYFPPTKWAVTKNGLDSNEYLKPENKKYRVISRGLVSTTGSRTLSSAIYPPHVTHVNGLCSLSFENDYITVATQSLFNSLIFDFYSRTISSGGLTRPFWEKLPYFHHETIAPHLMLRTLRLNCLSTQYNDLWSNVFDKSMKDSPSLEFYPPNLSNSKLTSKWGRHSALRDSNEREQALCEIDALVAMLMGVSEDDLIKLYRSQFGALQKKFKDLPGQNEEDSFPREKIMRGAYQMFLAHFGVTEKQVTDGYFLTDKKKDKAA